MTILALTPVRPPESCRELPAVLACPGADTLIDLAAPDTLPTTAPALAKRTRPIPRDALPSRQEREEGRRAAQAARDHAQAWYAALRLWDVHVPEVLTPSMDYREFTPGWEPITTLGEGGPLRPTALVTPMGEVREVEAARLISEMAASPIPDRRAAGQLLERVRGAFTAPRSLLREDGRWASPAPRMAGYAVAVLTLAVALGDRDAEGALRYAGAVMRRGGVAL